MSSITPRKIDVLIITAFPEELDAVLEVEEGAVENSIWQKDPHQTGREIFFRDFSSCGNETGKLTFAATVAYQIGKAPAAEVATYFIQNYPPQCLAMTGICAGRKDGNVNYGDVIVANRLWAYDTGEQIREVVEGKTKITFKHDYPTYNLDADWELSLNSSWKGFEQGDWLSQRPLSLEWQGLWVMHRLIKKEDPFTHKDGIAQRKEWSQVIQRLWAKKYLILDKLELTELGKSIIETALILGAGSLRPMSEFKVHVGALATGAMIQQNEDIFADITAQQAYTKGLDMESEVIGFLQHIYRKTIPYQLVIKGVQDFADQDKGRHFRHFAALASAECLIAFLREHLPPSTDLKKVRNYLQTGIFPQPEEMTYAQALDGRYAVVEFDNQGRQAIIDELLAWCDNAQAVSLRLLYGQGGMGKTRLLAEMCRQLTCQGWQAGFLREKFDPKSDWTNLINEGQRVFVVIDYAESQANLRDLIDFIPHDLRNSKRLRIVLLSRNAGDWWQVLKDKSRVLKTICDSPAQEISALAPKSEDKERLFFAAKTQFQKLFPQLNSNPQMPNFNNPLFERVLYLHMAALASALGLDTKPEQLLVEILSHEENLWLEKNKLNQTDIEKDLWLVHARGLLAMITLLGGVKNTSEADIIAGILRPNQDLSPIIALLKKIYSSNNMSTEKLTDLESEKFPYFSPLQPDLLGEALVFKVLQKATDYPPNLLANIFAQAELRSITHAFTLLGRMESDLKLNADDQEKIKAVIQIILSQDLHIRALPAYQAAMSVAKDTAFSPLADVLTSALEKNPSLVVAQIIHALGMPLQTVSLKKLEIWVESTLLKSHSESTSVELESDEKLATRAMYLNNLSVSQSEAGQHKEALASTEEAVEIRRKLANKNADAYLPVLAGSLNNLGNRQSEIGQHKEALASTAEALEIRRELANKNADAYLPVLAKSLNNLGAMQSSMGLHKEALTTIQEAVEIRRELAKKNQDAYLPDLAMSLNNLGNRQSEIGQHKEALASTAEAVEIYRQWAKKNQDAFLPDLAMSLNNLGNRQSEIGQHKEALTSTAEAVEIYRQLANKNADAYLPVLAKSLNNLGAMQSSMGLHKEALTTIQEAVEIRRELAKKNQDAYLPDLAMSLNNLGNRQSEAGDKNSALATYQEAFQIYWTLFEKLPLAFVQNTGKVLKNLLKITQELKLPINAELAQRAEKYNEFVAAMKKENKGSSG